MILTFQASPLAGTYFDSLLSRKIQNNIKNLKVLARRNLPDYNL